MSSRSKREEEESQPPDSFEVEDGMRGLTFHTLRIRFGVRRDAPSVSTEIDLVRRPGKADGRRVTSTGWEACKHAGSQQESGLYQERIYLSPTSTKSEDIRISISPHGSHLLPAPLPFASSLSTSLTLRPSPTILARLCSRMRSESAPQSRHEIEQRYRYR